jgi:hypothetical protein
MLTAEQSVINYVEKNGRTFKARLSDMNTGELAGSIKSLSIHKGSCSSYSFKPASIFSNYVDVTIDNFPTTQPIPTGKMIVEIGCPISGDTIWTKVATVQIQNPIRKMKRLTFTAEGVISAKLGKKFRSGSFSNVGELISALETEAGVTITVDDNCIANIVNLPLPSDVQYDKYYMRELLGYIAGLGFGYATEDVNGNIVIRTYNYHDKTINTSLSRMKSEPDFYDVTRPEGIEVIGLEDRQFITGALQNASLTNPLMTQEAFNSYSHYFLDVEYQPFDMNITLGNFLIEPVDIVSIADRYGTMHNLVPMSVTHKFTGGLSTTLKAPSLDSGEDYSRTDVSMQSEVSFTGLSLSIPSNNGGGSVGTDLVTDHTTLHAVDDIVSIYKGYMGVIYWDAYLINRSSGWDYSLIQIPAKYMPAYPVTITGLGMSSQGSGTDTYLAANSNRYTAVQLTLHPELNEDGFVKVTSAVSYLSPRDPYYWGDLMPMWLFPDFDDRSLDMFQWTRFCTFYILNDKWQDFVSGRI